MVSIRYFCCEESCWPNLRYLAEKIIIINFRPCCAAFSHPGMTCLTELDLSRCSKVNDAGIEHLISISNLKKLGLSETGVSAEGVMRLSCLQNLHILDLGGLPVTDRALRSLQV